MTEIKKGTPVWVWDYHPDEKIKAVYLCYDEGASDGYRNVARLKGRIAASCWKYAEPINETNEKAMQLIAEAKEKIAEAEKLLNAL